MKNKKYEGLIWSIAMTAFVLFCAFTVFDSDAATKPSFNFSDAHYLRTIDGDTFKVSIYCIHPIFGENLSVRLKGVDTYEIFTSDKEEKARGVKAKKFAEDILKNGTDLRLKNCVRGSLSRIVCDVSNSKTKDLAADLKKAGHAQP